MPEATIARDLTTVMLDVGGMKCAGCVRAVETQLTQHPGVIAATVNLVTEQATIECTPTVDPTALADRLTQAGFPSQPHQIEPASEPSETSNQTPYRQLAIAAVLLILSAIGHLEHFGWYIPGLSNIWFHFGLASIALAFPGRSIFIDGWRGARHNAPNMNTLVGLGTLTAYLASVVALLFPRLGWECFFDEPVMLVGFILLGRALEQQARTRATASLRSLLALQPASARLIAADPPQVDSEAIEVPARQVQIGAWVQVLPGDKIPVDGEIVAGQTTIDESMLTGEAIPVLKQPGDGVAAGSLNQSGAIAIRATRTGKETTLAQIISLVETAQTRKAPIQKLADRVAAYFTYGVLTIALLTFLFWYFIGIPLWPHVLRLSNHAAMEHELMYSATTSPLLLSLKLAIAVLVIACPCALGLATPTAILVGSGIGADRGLLIRGGDVLEKVHHLDAIAFDKTGTLTQGQPIVTDCHSCLPDVSDADLLQLAATVESGTRHPLAQAILQQAQQQNLAILSAEQFHTEAGFGVSAVVQGQTVRLGTQAWLEQHGIAISDLPPIAGSTIVYVACDQQFAGAIAVRDQLRPEARSIISQLQQMGLDVLLLTGDRLEAAQEVAQQLGIDRVYASTPPDRKAAVIAELQAAGQHMAMVGDGINDAPALAQADVSISLHSSTAVAIETAEIVLMRDRLGGILESIRLSRATFHKIRQNLFWAFAYNILGIPVAAGILLPTVGIALSPATAGAFMAFSSLSVVTNALLLHRQFPPRRISTLSEQAGFGADLKK
ncbi:copper-translocating P-type ATPase [Microcoleus sp. FACHB-1515]|uniref:heavy metal translocating P-type ATPase n=1 Tax=Cyanophyceae TaxID=3028117 RepID=UPI0016857FE6|nr:heavy metal translocating P-type ATPase [Microcoleus sp. FACHB-1515]MBD2092795.1 copper-translocating P-type ATPase [Microcoleus sp. FACHB-1515]